MNSHYSAVSRLCRLVFTGPAIVVAIAIVSISTSTAVGDHLDPTKTRYSLPLPEAPTIDGIIDPGEWVWAGGAAGNNWRIAVDEGLEDFVRGGQVANGEAPFDDTDLSFNIYVGHDSDNLYVAAQVTDLDIFDDTAEAESENGQTWLDDSVELFIDGDNSNFPDRDTTGENPEVVGTGGQFVITANNAYRHAEAGNPGYGENDAWYALTEWTDTGYDAEFRVSLDAIGNPQPGDVIGFSLAVNDDDDGGPAERQIIWAGATHVEESYGNLVIGGRSYTAPKAAAPTLDGVIGPDEYAGAEAAVVDRHTGVYNIPSGDDTWEEGDSSYTYWVTHDDEAVYVGVDVVDDEIFTDTAEAGSEDGQTWVDDSIEIFFDADDSNDEGRGAGEFEGQYVLTANGAWRDNEANNPLFGESDDWFAVTSETDTGYAIEFKVNKSALFDPEDGATLGWNVALNDDDGDGRKLQLNWNGRPHSEFTYGFLTLGPEASVATCDPNSGGDLDGNGTVEFADFLILSGNFGSEVSSHAEGDIDCNGTVEFADFLALSGNFGMEIAGTQSVPEPASSVMLCLGGLLVAYLRPRRHRK